MKQNDMQYRGQRGVKLDGEDWNLGVRCTIQNKNGNASVIYMKDGCNAMPRKKMAL